MYSDLLTLIGTTLDKVTSIGEHFNYPKTDINSFPAVYFQPDGMTNSFETTIENFKIYRFLMVVIVGEKGDNVDREQIFATILPGVVDDIVAQFDADWDGGTNDDGHRIWVKVDSADAWSVSEDQDGLMVYAPLNVEIKVLTDI